MWVPNRGHSILLLIMAVNFYSLTYCIGTKYKQMGWTTSSINIIGIGRFRILGGQGLEYWGGEGGPRGGQIRSRHKKS